MTVTEPRIEELHATADRIVMVRHSDETTAQMLCSLPDFIGQVSQLCEELGLTAAQTEKILEGVKRRLQ